MTSFHDSNNVPEIGPVAQFPFTALAGQPRLQQALLLAAVDPGIGGVLIRGPRGTAKSTAAKALAALLPTAPFVTLPLTATVEQLVGTLDLQDALRHGQVRLAPGLLARAHRGVLYVDEVNLLPDPLVDALLDAAASGVNTVERDGISRSHAARFVLIGTMNPEEGELRPQLLDRFGLVVDLDNPTDPAVRQAIVRTRLAFDEDPQTLWREQASAQEALAQQITQARGALAHIRWSEAAIAHATALALSANIDGVRGDLVLLKAARAQAAMQASAQVAPEHIEAVAELALAHRRQVGSRRMQTTASTAQSSPSADTPQAGRRHGDRPTGRGSERDSASTDMHSDWGALPAQPVEMPRWPYGEGPSLKKA